MAAVSVTRAYTTALSSAMQRRIGGLTPQITKRLPLLAYLTRKGRYKPGDGTWVELPIWYKTDDTEHSYSGMEVRPLLEQDDATTVPLYLKYYDGTVVIPSQLLKVENKGQKTFDALNHKQDAAILSVRKQLNRDLYLDGTGNGSKRVTGLAAAVPEDPTTGTYLSINRATAGNEYWRSQIKDTNAASYTAATTTTSIYDDARNLRILCGRLDVGDNRYPDFAICTETYLEYMDNVILKTGNRFVNEPMRDMGYKAVQFFGVTLLEDQACPLDLGSDQQAIYLNSEFVTMFYAPAMNFSQTELQQAPNQHGMSALIEWAGELGINCPGTCGRHMGLKAPA